MRFLFSLFFVFISYSCTLWAFTPVKAAFLIDAKTGKSIYGYNEDVQTQPASLTKMMTLLLTFRALRQGKITMNSKVKITRNAARQRPCILGLKQGETILVKDAILAIITKSANDIAVALSERVAGNENTFVYMMNKEARRLGMRSTRFMNPSGWKNPRQLTTARDVAKLARVLTKEYPNYYHMFSTQKFSYKKVSMRNHNHLLGAHGDMIVDGIKTGYVGASGYNLAASAVRGNHRLIAVVLGGQTAKQRDAEIRQLLKSGFARLQRRGLSSVITQMNTDSLKDIPSSLVKGNKKRNKKVKA